MPYLSDATTDEIKGRLVASFTYHGSEVNLIATFVHVCNQFKLGSVNDQRGLARFGRLFNEILESMKKEKLIKIRGNSLKYLVDLYDPSIQAVELLRIKI